MSPSEIQDCSSKCDLPWLPFPGAPKAQDEKPSLPVCTHVAQRSSVPAHGSSVLCSSKQGGGRNGRKQFGDLAPNQTFNLFVPQFLLALSEDWIFFTSQEMLGSELLLQNRLMRHMEVPFGLLTASVLHDLPLLKLLFLSLLLTGE